jgi:hypothetical protein
MLTRPLLLHCRLRDQCALPGLRPAAVQPTNGYTVKPAASLRECDL